MDNFLNLAMTACLLVVVASRSGVFLRQGLQFKSYALLFLIAPLPGMIGAALYHHQSIPESLYANRNILFWLTYFSLHALNIRKEDLIKILLFAGAVWALLTIIQQFTYPHYWFYLRNESQKSFVRAGVYRFMIPGSALGIFLLMYHFHKYAVSSKLIHAFWTFIGLAGMYYYGTRQNAVAAFVCMFIIVLLLKGNTRWRNLVVMMGIVLVAYGLKELLFSELIELTNRQIATNDEDIRYVSARFFLFDYWPHSSWAKWLGNGMAASDTAYLKELTMYAKIRGLYRSDVGIIGSFNQYGITYVVLVLCFLLKGITIKIKSQEHRYLKIFFFYPAILLIINEGFTYPEGIVYICCVMYLMDKSIVEEKAVKMLRSKQAETLNENLIPMAY